MPIFGYAFPVTATASALLSLAALTLEGGAAAAAGVKGGVVGWLMSGTYCPLVMYLAVGPGIVGHTGFNTLLKYDWLSAAGGGGGSGAPLLDSAKRLRKCSAQL